MIKRTERFLSNQLTELGWRRNGINKILLPQVIAFCALLEILFEQLADPEVRDSEFQLSQSL